MSGSEPRRRATRSGWFALSVTVLARAVLTILVSLLGWSLAPAALGWHTTVVMTGSMLPKLVPGDLVVSRSIDPAKLSIGQVVLLDNPDHAGQLRLHRFVRVAPGGRLILRGDANARDDSSPVAQSAVHGVAALHIPDLGRPVLWASEGQVVPIVLTALALIALVGAAFWWRPAERGETTSDASSPTRSAWPSRHRSARQHHCLFLRHGPRRGPCGAHSSSARPRWCSSRSPPATPAPPRSSSRTPPPMPPTPAASTFFTCANAVKAATPTFALPLGESSGTTAADTSGNGNAGTYSGGVTYGVTGPCTHDSKTAVTLNGTTGTVAVGTADTAWPSPSRSGSRRRRRRTAARSRSRTTGARRVSRLP